MTITLRRDPIELILDPAQGGAVLAFRRGDFDIFHASDPAVARNHTCFPLVPFSGRIDHGRFSFDGRDYQIAPNFPPEPHAIHGDGWTSAWDVTAQDASSATLTLTHDAADAAFQYQAEQRFVLHPDRLELALAVTHRGRTPMPYGLGLHPYFARRPDALLSAEVSSVWLPDDTNIPRRLAPVPVEWGFRLRRPVEELDLDHNFQGWSSTARIDWPDSALALTIEADPIFRNLVVYVPKGKPYFCVEPVSHAADGINLMNRGIEDTGVRVLATGERLTGTVTFRLSSL